MFSSNICTSIFVIGKHRSGTTWITNILSSHPHVFTPAHEVHKGQHESAFFSSLAPYCRWGKAPEDRIALQAIFEQSDYFKLLFPHITPNINCHDIYDYFQNIMNESARHHKCTHWIEKTPAHTLLLSNLISLFPKAKFIAVTRKRLSAIRSMVFKVKTSPCIFHWMSAAMRKELYDKIIHFNKKYVYLVRYEDFQHDYQKASSQLFAYIGLNGNTVISSHWSRDSSFTGSPPKIRFRNKIVVFLVAVFFIPIPARFCNWLGLKWSKYRRPKLPHWFFKIYQGKPHQDT